MPSALVVFAHPERRSFNGALLDAAVAALTETGHHVEVTDLYAQGFKATADADDFSERADATYLRVDREQTAAHERGSVAPDIAREQDALAAADLLILQFPLWWFGPPAILKGWFDRVFTRGFAYLPGRKYDTGLLRGKTALVSVTTGTSADTYAPDGIDGALTDILWPIHNGVLRYTGFEVLTPNAVHMPARLSDDDRAAALRRYAQRLRRLEHEPRLYFHPAAHYGPEERLLPHIVPASGFQHRPH